MNLATRAQSDTPLALPEKIAGIKYVLSDVDDTITTSGKLLAQTYTAINQLAEQNIAFIPITGGCAGWCDSFARLWPCDAVIGENGGFYLRKNASNQLIYHFWQSEQERSENHAKLKALAKIALTRYPEVAMAKDQSYRLVDLAIDYNQDVTHVSTATLESIIDIFESEGANAKASSIHINAWIGDYNKKVMACHLLATEFNLSVAQMKEQVLFIGDSLNDESMFEFFPNSVGVANIEQHLPAFKHKPKWITSQSYGIGFEQMVQAVINA